MLEEMFGKKKWTDSEAQLASYVEADPRHILGLSLEELSEECFCSQASVIRFCKKLGCKGFSEFKIRLAQEIHSYSERGGKIHVDVPIQSGSDAKEVAETFYELTNRAIKNAYQNLDYLMLKRAANLLYRADLIHIYGRGESLILAEDFHYKLLRIGKHSSLETLNGFLEAKCLQVDKKLSQVAVVITHYCNSQQIRYIMDELSSSKMPFILLTAAEDAYPMDVQAAAVLKVASSESRFKMGSFASRSAMTFVLDCLYGVLFSMDYEKNKENLTEFSRRKVEREYFYMESAKEGKKPRPGRRKEEGEKEDRKEEQ